jgi:pyrroline-5-carboxylate reductase
MQLDVDRDRVMSPVGFIGVGEIAAAIVEGICNGPAPHPDIHLSPRGADTAAALARRHPTARVCPDNRSVAEAARLIVLAVRPGAVDEALREVRMKPGSVLVSTVAGVDHDHLARRLEPHVTIVRAIPLPAVRHREGFTAVHPAYPAVTALFGQLGGTCGVPTDRAFTALSAATATVSAHLGYLACVADWLTQQGMPSHAADRYVRSTFAGIGRGLEEDTTSLADLLTAHETPQGINEQLRRAWFDAPAQSALHGALDGILTRLTPSAR